jgi:hypothetical protein
VLSFKDSLHKKSSASVYSHDGSHVIAGCHCEVLRVWCGEGVLKPSVRVVGTVGDDFNNNNMGQEELALVYGMLSEGYAMFKYVKENEKKEQRAWEEGVTYRGGSGKGSW